MRTTAELVRAAFLSGIQTRRAAEFFVIRNRTGTLWVGATIQNSFCHSILLGFLDMQIFFDATKGVWVGGKIRPRALALGFRDKKLGRDVSEACLLGRATPRTNQSPHSRAAAAKRLIKRGMIADEAQSRTPEARSSTMTFRPVPELT